MTMTPTRIHVPCNAPTLPSTAVFQAMVQSYCPSDDLTAEDLNGCGLHESDDAPVGFLGAGLGTGAGVGYSAALDVSFTSDTSTAFSEDDDEGDEGGEEEESEREAGRSNPVEDDDGVCSVSRLHPLRDHQDQINSTDLSNSQGPLSRELGQRQQGLGLGITGLERVDGTGAFDGLGVWSLHR